MTEASALPRPGYEVAYHHLPGAAPGVLFCGGFKSDMTGTKALALEAWCAHQGHACTRFDYLGHGASGGRFEDGTISRWRDDALAVLDTVTQGPQVVVGSSMGGWIALLLARARATRVAGLVLLAPAPDFTQPLLASLDATQRAALARDGMLRRPSAYSEEPYVFTRALLEDGARMSVLDAPLKLGCPVRILHGMQDQDVPWPRSVTLAEHIHSPDLCLTLVRHGDHRLSTAPDLARLNAAVAELLATGP